MHPANHPAKARRINEWFYDRSVIPLTILQSIISYQRATCGVGHVSVTLHRNARCDMLWDTHPDLCPQVKMLPERLPPLPSPPSPLLPSPRVEFSRVRWPRNSPPQCCSRRESVRSLDDVTGVCVHKQLCLQIRVLPMAGATTLFGKGSTLG